jgi:hypothetical protein
MVAKSIPAQAAITALQDKVFPTQFTFAASAAVGTIVNGTMYPYGLQNPANTTQFQVPQGSKYQLVDLYLSSSPGIDGQIIFNLNGVPQGENLILSTLVASNSARAKITQPLTLEPGDIITVQVVSSASSTATLTDTLYMHFVQVPA